MKNESKGILALTLLAALYGITGAVARVIAPGLHPMQQVYVRLIPAFILMLVLFQKHFYRSHIKELSQREWALLVFRTACFYLVAVPLYIFSAQHAKLGVIAALQILPWTVFFGVVLNRERLTLLKSLLVAFSFVGAYFASVKAGLAWHNFGVGELASIVSGAFFSLGYVTRKWHRSQLNDLEISTLMIGLGLLLSLTISIVAKEGLPHPTTTPAWWVLVVLASGVMNIGIVVLANFGFGTVKDVLANNIMTLEAVFGTLFGLMLYGEVPGLRETTGMLIIVTAALLSSTLLRSKKAQT